MPHSEDLGLYVTPTKIQLRYDLTEQEWKLRILLTLDAMARGLVLGGGPQGFVVRLDFADGTSPKVFAPSDSTPIARGAALKKAIAESVSGDSIKLGFGEFSDSVPFVFKDGVSMRGESKFITLLTCTGGGAAAASIISGTVSLAEMSIAGLTAEDSTVTAFRVRFDAKSISGISALALTDPVATQADSCDFLTDGTASVSSNDAGTQVSFNACVANADLDANVLPVPENGITIDPNFA